MGMTQRIDIATAPTSELIALRESVDQGFTDMDPDAYDALEDELYDREQAAERRAARHQYAAWKGAHNRRLHNGGF
jgi:hypothetical protein